MDVNKINASIIVDTVIEKAQAIRNEILNNKLLGKDIDRNISIIPKPYMGTGEIKVIIIGQDPTVREATARMKINTALNLDKRRSLFNYVDKIMKYLGYTLENLYATNFYKCFFTAPHTHGARRSPIGRAATKVLAKHLPFWLNLVKEEISYFPKAKILTLGEALIGQLVTGNNIGKREKLVKYYWGYNGGRERERFKYVQARENILGVDFYPLPHHPFIKKKFYKEELEKYMEFCRKAKSPGRPWGMN